MELNRRSLLQGTGALLAGFAIPKTPETDPTTINDGNVALWIVVLAGNSRSKPGLEAFKAAQKRAKDDGFTLFDTMHSIQQRSRFLARKEVSRKYAEEQEAVTIGELPRVGDLNGIGEGIIALWIESPERQASKDSYR